MLVEDNQLNQMIARDILEKAGATVEAASTGAEALLLFNATGEKHYDVVLMDIRMPDMDGNTATLRIREQEASTKASPVPIIAITAHAMDSEIQDAMAAGMNGVCCKPFLPQDLIQVILKYTSESSKPTLPAPAGDDGHGHGSTL